MISKNVNALDSNGNNITGVVQSVSIQNGEPQLVINGSNVSLSNIQSIQPDTATQTTQDTQADTDTLSAIIQMLSTSSVLTTRTKNAEQSLSNIEQILLMRRCGYPQYVGHRRHLNRRLVGRYVGSTTGGTGGTTGS